MIELPFACYCSELKVNPKNWLSKNAPIKKDWFVYCRFYDPTFKNNPKFKKGKLVILKAMNQFKAITERHSHTQHIIENELQRLKNEAYNPITGNKKETSLEVNEIDSNTPFIKALYLAEKRISCSPSSKRDLKSILNFVSNAAIQLRYSELPISTVSRKHFKQLLLHIDSFHGESTHRFNKIRSYLIMAIVPNMPGIIFFEHLLKIHKSFTILYAMSREITNGNTIITLPDDVWKAEKSGPYNWRLRAVYGTRKLQVFLYQSYKITEADFFANSASMAIKQGRSGSLKPFGSIMQMNKDKRVIYQELRKTEGLFRVDDKLIYYMAMLVKNDDETKNIYGYASMEFPADEDHLVDIHCLDFFYLFPGIQFVTLPQYDFSQLFKKPANEFNRFFTNCRWRRSDDYNSGNYAGGGGYSIEETFDFYSDGTFRYKYTYVVSGGSYQGMSLGGGYKEDKGTGAWSISGTTLILKFTDGRNKQYEITASGTKGTLNGENYTRYKLP